MFGFSVSSDYMESEMYVAPAILLSPNENLNVKLGIPIGITSESYDYRVDLSMEHTF
jgi:hypothetical protein